MWSWSSQIAANTPHVGVVALLPEAGANGGALLLDNGALVGDGLCGAHVANELLDWTPLACMHSWGQQSLAYERPLCRSRGPHPRNCVDGMDGEDEERGVRRGCAVLLLAVRGGQSTVSLMVDSQPRVVGPRPGFAERNNAGWLTRGAADVNTDSMPADAVLSTRRRPGSNAAAQALVCRARS